MARLYQAADIGIVTLKDIPLLDGARPSKMLPMMSSGLPIVFSGRGEGPALLAEAGGGRSVPPENAPELAAALMRLIEDPGARSLHGQRGRSFVVANYSWTTVIERFILELTTLLATDGGEQRRAARARSRFGRVRT